MSDAEAKAKAQIEQRYEHLIRRYGHLVNNTGGKGIAELMALDVSTFTNLPVTMLQVAVLSQMTLLEALTREGFLGPWDNKENADKLRENIFDALEDTYEGIDCSVDLRHNAAVDRMIDIMRRNHVPLAPPGPITSDYQWGCSFPGDGGGGPGAAPRIWNVADEAEAWRQAKKLGPHNCMLHKRPLWISAGPWETVTQGE
jgi:hypothetical protein